MAEYIHNRRLAFAGNALLITDEKLIDIAMKYEYDSPDSLPSHLQDRRHDVWAL